MRHLRLATGFVVGPLAALLGGCASDPPCGPGTELLAGRCVPTMAAPTTVSTPDTGTVITSPPATDASIAIPDTGPVITADAMPVADSGTTTLDGSTAMGGCTAATCPMFAMQIEQLFSSSTQTRCGRGGTADDTLRNFAQALANASAASGNASPDAAVVMQITTHAGGLRYSYLGYQGLATGGDAASVVTAWDAQVMACYGIFGVGAAVSASGQTYVAIVFGNLM